MVAIVSEAMARRSWPGEDPIGKKIRLQTKWIPAEWSELEVVGVAGNVRSANLSRIDPAFVYVPTSAAKLAGWLVLLRVRNDPKKAITAMREALERLDGRPRPGFSPVSLNDGVLRPQILMARTFTFSALFLALLAVVLTSIGIYGVMACLVGERQREMGIRMALGASTGDVLRLMITQGMRPVVIGSALGLVGALGVSAVLRALLVFPGSFDILYGARWFDPVTFVGMSCVLMSIALLACYIPTRRATHLDPAVVLRYD
jgi:predicted lysophospholipase L1 biosynthesis ABC-type transport system permease subunit